MKIGNHEWTIKIVSRNEINNCDGRTKPNDLEILIADDLKGQTRQITFLHELTHAILDEQGRCYDKNTTIENMCEFIGWNFEEIERCLNEFVEEIGL